MIRATGPRLVIKPVQVARCLIPTTKQSMVENASFTLRAVYLLRLELVTSRAGL